MCSSQRRLICVDCMLMMTMLLPSPGSNRPVSTILHAELSGGISLLKHVIIGERP